MKVLLTSDGLSTDKLKKKFIELVNKPVDKIKVLFIPTAKNPEKDQSYMERNTKELFDLGIKKENLIEYDLDKKNKFNDFDLIDVIYVGGGNTFYLLKRIRETGFDKTIKDLIKNDKVYVGVSAGSIIAGPNIKTATPYDNNQVNLKDLTGLNLADISILPHNNNNNNNNNNEKSTIHKLKKQVSNLQTLKDGEALLIIDNKIEVIK